MDAPHPRVAFGWDVVELPGEVMLTVTGDVDIAVTREFRRRLDDAVRPGGALLIDLTAVTFLDGPGYRAIRAAAAAVPGVPGTSPCVTVATKSVLVAAVLQAIAGSVIVLYSSCSTPAMAPRKDSSSG